MTIKPRVVRALRDARTRLRDVAAAEHSTTSAMRERAAQTVVERQHDLRTALDNAGTTLAAARTIWEVDRVAEDTGVHRFAVVDASTAHHKAIVANDATADRLRERARQLRTAERLVEMVDDFRAKQEATAEQRSADDMASSASGRRK